ncbi:N-carbamoyl-L-amino acid hydrolase (EC [Olavius algarvensis Delta 1 endosymbiont]|nr:N-carbamoyl-L-amino acid hydrolase (EC [Olavius algarvensis Delta 1 endosymbiont]
MQNEQKDRVDINPERLWNDLQELAKIGYREGRGVSRPALSDSDMAAKAWHTDRIQAAGLAVRLDAAANVIGTLPATGRRPQKVLAIGSHLDTVPQGGKFEGALGVLAGLECARVIREHGIELPWDLEVINFCDEEAAHNAGTVGSRAMLGQLQPGEIYVSKAKGSATFAEALKRSGKDPQKIHESVRDPNLFEAMLELHIEQGSRLESEGIRIGVVTGIVGIYRYIVTVKGEADHAGTTPMHLRNDAQSFASHVPSGMVFIPCYKGKSHCPQESIEPQQAWDGCRVLLRTVLALARQHT